MALQAVIAMGKIIDVVPYHVERTDCFHPWRRNLRFFQSREAPIRPLIASLRFIQDPKRCGDTPARAMGCDEALLLLGE